MDKLSKEYKIKSGEVVFLIENCYNFFIDSGGIIKSIYDNNDDMNKNGNFIEPEEPKILKIGNYTARELYKRDVVNKSIKSIVLGPMTRVYVYKNDNFIGKKYLLENNDYDKIKIYDCHNLKKYDLVDTISSITIEGMMEMPFKGFEINDNEIAEEVQLENTTPIEDLELEFEKEKTHNEYYNTDKVEIIEEFNEGSKNKSEYHEYIMMGAFIFLFYLVFVCLNKK